MNRVKAPYRFIPVSDYVYYPSWANKISQDIPFKDSNSGYIEYDIEAITPIFIRNGHSKADAADKNSTFNSFCNINGRYYIPATSLKGAVRNIFEILTFSKMTVDKYSKFAQREWNNPLKTISLNKSKLSNKAYCGWLKYDQKYDRYFIQDCGEFKRINHKRLDEYFGEEIMTSKFSQSGIDLNKEIEFNSKKYDPKTARYKYEITNNRELRVHYSKDEYYDKGHVFNKVLVTSDENDPIGTIVFTGQPNKWKEERSEDAGKFYEFIFPDENLGEYDISEEQYLIYKSIYLKSPDWIYHSKNINTTGIPVFFRKKDEKIEHFGLALLYKLPYNKTVAETLASSHRGSDLDMAESVFGFTSTPDRKESLKGRVQFSHAFATEAEEGSAVKLTLSSPKASFYPFYIRQDESQLKTYNDGKLAGWKRYVNRRNPYPKNSDSDVLDTEIFPLKEGAKFKGKIYFHNLKEQELGALISAVTLHGKSENAFYQIGQAKPYGYGRIKINNVNIFKQNYEKGIEEKLNILPLLKIFELDMFKWNPKLNWAESSEIRQLLGMLTSVQENLEEYNYLTLGVKGSKENEFEYIKNEKNLSNDLLNELKKFFDVSTYSDVKHLTKEEINEYWIEDKEKRNKDYQVKELQRQQEDKERNELEKKKKQELKDEQEKAKAARILAIEEKGLDVTALKDFNAFSREIEKYIKLLKDKIESSTLSSNDIEHLLISLTRIKPEIISSRDIKKVWNINGDIGKKCIKWGVSKERLEAWFNENVKR